MSEDEYSIQPFPRPKAVERLRGAKFASAEVITALNLSAYNLYNLTQGAKTLALVGEKGRGKAGRRFPVVDVWTLALYQRLVRLTDAGPPVKAALARFLEGDLFTELGLPETFDCLEWREANPRTPVSAFKPSFERTKADLEAHREAIRAKIAADPFEAPAMWWSRDEGRAWFVTIDLDSLARDKLALKSGREMNPLSIQKGVDMPEFWDFFGWPAAGLFVNATQLLAEVDDRLLAIVAAR